MSKKIKETIYSFQKILSERDVPTTKNDIITTMANALVEGIGSVRLLFYLTNVSSKTNALDLIPCLAHQLSENIFVHDPHSNQAYEFTFKTNYVYHTPVNLVKTPAFGILFVETDKGLLTETEQLLINLLSIQIGYMLDYLYRFDTVIPQKEILKIDSVGRHVWLEGKSVHLSPNELTLLKLLYDYQDKTCSRAFIRQTVYPDEFTDDTLPNFSGMRRKIHYREDRLDVLVSKLRRKLKLLSDDTIKIETVWGKGYWLKIEADSAKIK